MKYKVLDYFEWGQLKLDKGQIIVIENQDDGDALVYVEHYPEKSQVISGQAMTNMVSLKKIKEY